MKKILVFFTLILAMGCGPDGGIETGMGGDTDPTAQGLNSLYMGHSYFRRQAEAMDEYAEIAGIEGHHSTTHFWGGLRGS